MASAARMAPAGLLMGVCSLTDASERDVRVPAFPGAEGYGAQGPRMVVFAVSGNIDLKANIHIVNPYLTIAGQTSPGGICLRYCQLIVNVKARSAAAQWIMKGCDPASEWMAQSRPSTSRSATRARTRGCAQRTSVLQAQVLVLKGELPAEDPRHGGDHRQPRPVQPQLSTPAHFRRLPAQKSQRSPRVPRLQLQERPGGGRMSSWTARGHPSPCRR